MLILLTIVFGSFNMADIISEILFSIALFLLFPECGVKRYWALVPFLRIYFLGKCADRIPEGKVTACVDVLRAALGLAFYYMSRGSMFYFLAGTLSVMTAVIGVIYRIRIYSGICEVYQASKLWILLWFTFPFIPAAIWGFSHKYDPVWTVKEMEEENAARISGTYISNMGPGHMVLLLGGSGAGKTTLINAINGYEKARASVLLNGNNVYKNYKTIQYEIGYVPQRDLMRDNDTVLRTLSDSAALRMPLAADAQARKKQVDEVLGIFGLEPVKNSLVEKLSGGQRKRLSIAMEFVANPSLFILDEPDSGLDGVMARSLMTRLRKIADSGKIVIVITHTPDRVIDLFDDVIVLAKDSHLTGRLAYYGSVEDARVFFGKEKMEQIVMSINRMEEGGEGRADEFVEKYLEVQNA